MSDDPHHCYMNEAIRLARQAASLGEVPVGAVIVHDEVIIARGHNQREMDQDPTAHAELIAIRRAAAALGSWRLEGCTVYVTLEPCPMCAGLMIQSRMERVVFGCTDPKGGFCGTLFDISNMPGLNHQFEVVGGVEEQVCASLLKEFFRDLRSRRKERWPSG